MPEQPHHALIRLLAPLLAIRDERQAFVTSALGLDNPYRSRLNFDLAAEPFIFHLCQIIAPDTAALDALLDEVKRERGIYVADEIERLRQPLNLWLRAGAPNDSTPKKRVFLSYARADDDPDYDSEAKSFLRRLYNGLTVAGFAVWWDRVSLPSRGMSFTKEIEDAIRACDRLALIVAPGALASHYVHAEWTFAFGECKPVIPLLRMGDYEIMPPELRTFSAIDCRPTRDEQAALADIIARLREDAPLAALHNVRALPHGHITRAAPFAAAHAALTDDTIQSTIISAEAVPKKAATVYGVGGIGKSTLASALAHDCDVRRTYHNGVIWLEIGQKPSIQTRQGDLGVALGDLREQYVGAGTDEKSGAARLSWLLRDKQALIVLDDVWDARVIDLFPVAGTACRLLITTRSAALASRVSGAEVKLHLLTEDEGAALIEARAGAGDMALYRQISTALGGHTLAVRLASDQLANGYADDAADLLRLLTRRDNPFAHLKLADDDKDENVELSLSLSYMALKPEMQRRFRSLGTLAMESTFSREMLALLWGDADEDDARAPLQTLLGAGLLDAAGEGIYSQHRLLRAYARALLTEAGEGETDATFGHYAAYVTQKAKAFDELPPEQWVQLDALIPHVVEVGNVLTDSYAERMPEWLSEFAENVKLFIKHRMQIIERPNSSEARGLRWLEAALAVHVANGDQSKQAVMLYSIGEVWSDLWDKEKALSYYERALQLYKQFSDLQSEASTLHNIGAVWSALWEKQKALEYYERALLLRRQIEDRRGEAATLNGIGLVWDSLKEQKKALEYYERALPLRRQVGDRRGEATTLHNIGAVWSGLGEKQKALEYYEQALPLRRQVGDRRGEATTLHNIGAVWSRLGEKQKALEYYEQALPLRRQVGDRGGEAITLHNIGAVWSGLGEKQKALEYYEQSLLLRRQVADRRGQAATLSNIGLILAQLGENKKALGYYEQALALYREVREWDREVLTLERISSVYKATGAFAEEATSRANLATTLYSTGQVTEAVAELENIIAIIKEHKLQYDASGQTLESLEEQLAKWRGGS
jgi:tetratricopeptide (TPR) repeat protein